MTGDADGGRLILVVEDSADNRLLVEAVLQSQGYRVNTAGSADEALESLRGAIPDLILMDIQLPGQDGLSLTRQLRADPSTATIPIVALTANAMRGDAEKAFAAGCVGYMTKPIDTRSFGVEIRRFMHASESPTEQMSCGSAGT